MALEEQVVDLLLDKGYHISFAESCTGGLCCGTLVNVTNASKVLNVSFVTYANEAKMAYLNVAPDTILANGVVSEEVAYEMALGAANAAETGRPQNTARSTERNGADASVCPVAQSRLTSPRRNRASERAFSVYGLPPCAVTCGIPNRYSLWPNASACRRVAKKTAVRFSGRASQ